LTHRSFAEIELVAIYVDGIIVASHHIIAAVGVDAQGNKHVLGLAPGSSENAKVVKDLLGTLADRGVDLNVARLWVIDGPRCRAQPFSPVGLPPRCSAAASTRSGT